MNRIYTDLRLRDLLRSFSWMLHAGISLADSAFLLAEDSRDEALTRLGQLLDGGQSLSEALAELEIFPTEAVGMLRMAEASGRLEETLAALAEFYDRRHRMKAKLRSAVTYPAMILALMLLVMGVLLVKVLPVFEDVYASLGTRLTGIAAGMLEFGRLLGSALPVLLMILALVIVLGFLCRRSMTEFLRRRFGDRGISRKYNNARFAEALTMGLSSGMELEQTLVLAEQMLSHIPGAARRVALCREMLARGADLAEAMAAAQLLDSANCRLLALGLRSGNGDRVMAQIAADLTESADAALDDRIGKVEPALVLAASFLVGGILLAVMLPLMNILSSLG